MLQKYKIPEEIKKWERTDGLGGWRVVGQCLKILDKLAVLMLLVCVL